MRAREKKDIFEMPYKVQALWAWLKAFGGPRSITEISQVTGMTYPQVRAALEMLRGDGMVSLEGAGCKSAYRATSTTIKSPRHEREEHREEDLTEGEVTR